MHSLHYYRFSVLDKVFYGKIIINNLASSYFIANLGDSKLLLAKKVPYFHYDKKISPESINPDFFGLRFKSKEQKVKIQKLIEYFKLYRLPIFFHLKLKLGNRRPASNSEEWTKNYSVNYAIIHINHMIHMI